MSGVCFDVLYLWLSAFLMVQFSHPYVTGKAIAFYKDVCKQSDVSAF